LDPPLPRGGLTHEVRPALRPLYRPTLNSDSGDPEGNSTNRGNPRLAHGTPPTEVPGGDARLKRALAIYTHTTDGMQDAATTALEEAFSLTGC